MKIERFSQFDGMYQAMGSYSLAVVSESKRLMFISGLGGMDADGKLAEDFEGQARLVLPVLLYPPAGLSLDAIFDHPETPICIPLLLPLNKYRYK